MKREFLASNEFKFQFRLYPLLYSFAECHGGSAAPISTYLRRGPRGCFRSECCTGGESMTAPRVNCFLAPSH